MYIYIYREQILEGLKLVKPSLVATVPMLFNRIYDSVMKKIGEGSPMKQKVDIYSYTWVYVYIYIN
jgi:long-subunit acyl-CoA synthetase (AMP-forming)